MHQYMYLEKVLHLDVEVLKTGYNDQNGQDCDKHASKIHDEGGLVHCLRYKAPLLFSDQGLRTDGCFRVCLRRRYGTRGRSIRRNGGRNRRSDMYNKVDNLC